MVPSSPNSEPLTAVEAIRNAHEWFEMNSGWAPPDVDTLAEWVAAGVCRCPDECLGEPRGWCERGLASWCLVLVDLESRPVGAALECLRSLWNEEGTMATNVPGG